MPSFTHRSISTMAVTSIAAVLIAASTSGVAAAHPMQTASPALQSPLAANAPSSSFAKMKITVNWKKEIGDAIKGFVVEKVIDKVLSITVPSSEKSTFAVPYISAGAISTPTDLVTRSRYASGLSPRVSYAYSEDPRALFNATLRSGVTQRKSNNRYLVGVTTVTFTPGTSSSPPAITIASATQTNKIVVLAP